MFWAKRKFTHADYASSQDLLAKMQQGNAHRYAEFIMVSVKKPDDGVGVSEYYIGVPSAVHLMPFKDFEQISESELPKVIDVVHLADTTKEPFRNRFKMSSW